MVDLDLYSLVCNCHLCSLAYIVNLKYVLKELTKKDVTDEKGHTISENFA